MCHYVSEYSARHFAPRNLPGSQTLLCSCADALRRRHPRSPSVPQAPQDNWPITPMTACPRHSKMLSAPPSLADRGPPRIPEFPPPVDLPGSPPLTPPPRRAGSSLPTGSGLIQPASWQFWPLFYGGAGRAKFPPHPSSGAVRAPRRAQKHGRRAGGSLPP